MKSVLIIGTGRLAHALMHHLSGCNAVRLAVAGRSAERRAFLAERYGIQAFTLQNFHEANADVLLLAVRDDAVETLAAQLDARDVVVVHHAGSLSLEAVSRHHTHAGVLYPLQTFAVPEAVCWKEIPLLIQATTARAEEALSFLAQRLGGPVRLSSDQERERLHLCAVCVNNFSRLLLAEAQHLCETWHLPLEILEPLVKHTFTVHPFSSPQKPLITGPAARGDEKTIQRHLKLLEEHPEVADTYKFLTEKIRRLMNT